MAVQQTRGREQVNEEGPNYWRADCAVRGADFRITRAGQGDSGRWKAEQFLEALEEAQPLPPPLHWSVGITSQTACIEYPMDEHWQGDALVRYKFILRGKSEGTMADLFFWCLERQCDTSAFDSCSHEWWRKPSKHLLSWNMVALKCAKCMTNDYVDSKVAEQVAIHGDVPLEYAVGPGKSYAVSPSGERRLLPRWPPVSPT